jgi:hypothetical protein
MPSRTKKNTLEVSLEVSSSLLVSVTGVGVIWGVGVSILLSRADSKSDCASSSLAHATNMNRNRIMIKNNGLKRMNSLPRKGKMAA